MPATRPERDSTAGGPGDGGPGPPSPTVPFSLGDLLLYFPRLGTLGFGGPIALAGHMQRHLVEERRWIPLAGVLLRGGPRP
jgi:hypothetical protein